jgi:hypothetical protein
MTSLLEFWEEFLCFFIDEFYILDIISLSVSRAILTRARDQLDRVDMIESISEEDSDSPRPSIEIEEDSFLLGFI